MADVSGLYITSAVYTLCGEMFLEWSFLAGLRARQEHCLAS